MNSKCPTINRSKTHARRAPQLLGRCCTQLRGTEPLALWCSPDAVLSKSQNPDDSQDLASTKLHVALFFQSLISGIEIAIHDAASTERASGFEEI